MKVPSFLFLFSVQLLAAQSIPWSEKFDNQSVPSYFEGNISRFTILNNRLYLNHISPAPQNESQIVRYAPIKYGEPLLWELNVALDFTPSPQNNLKIYLASSHPHLKNAENAWFLQVGGETGDQDKLSLFRQKNNQRTLLAESKPGILGDKAFNISFRVLLDETGLWQVFTKADSSQIWLPSFDYAGKEELKGFYTGLLLTYTASRAKQFNFDDWKMEGLLLDLTKPVVDKWTVNSLQHLQIYFSKPLDKATNKLVDFQCREVEGEKKTIQSVTLDSVNPYLLHFYIDTLKPNITYEFQGKVTDRSKNENNFSFYFDKKTGVKPFPGDVLFTEILATPSSGKQAEFIELHNPTNQFIQLVSAKIIVNKSTLELPDLILSAGEYLVIHHLKDSLFFKEVKHTFGSSSFPSLPNAGGTIELMDLGVSLDKMTYGLFPAWQHSVATGKSLEKRSLSHLSDCLLNWTSSSNDMGHSMGIENDAFSLALPFFEPLADHIFPSSADTLQFIAHVPLKWPDTTDLSLFKNQGLEIKSIVKGSPANEWTLHLKKPIDSGIIYPFTVLKGLKNCLGQENNQPQVLRLAIPQKPEKEESIFINEILFDALPFQKPFVEIQANTKYPIDMNYLHWGDRKEVNFSQRVLFPFEPYAITENPAALIQQYGSSTENQRIIAGKMPFLNRSQGSMSLFYDELETDIISYDKAWHSPWLRSTTGISLERKGAQSNGSNQSGWLSAAGFKIGASPGRENTSFGKEQSLVNEAVFLNPPSFTPYNQLQCCTISSVNSGSIVNIRIFDSFGNEVKYLVKNQVLGSNDEICWDGKQQYEVPLAQGHYIWWIELLNANGVRTIFRLLSTLD
jgi:hypothetical protein